MPGGASVGTLATLLRKLQVHRQKASDKRGAEVLACNSDFRVGLLIIIWP
jgi:hypothetical protein